MYCDQVQLCVLSVAYTDERNYGTVIDDFTWFVFLCKSFRRKLFLADLKQSCHEINCILVNTEGHIEMQYSGTFS